MYFTIFIIHIIWILRRKIFYEIIKSVYQATETDYTDTDFRREYWNGQLGTRIALTRKCVDSALDLMSRHYLLSCAIYLCATFYPDPFSCSSCSFAMLLTLVNIMLSRQLREGSILHLVYCIIGISILYAKPSVANATTPFCYAELYPRFLFCERQRCMSCLAY